MLCPLLSAIGRNMNGSMQRASRRAAILVTAAVLLAALAPAFAWAEPTVTALPFVVSGFGPDPTGSAGPRVTMEVSPPYPDGWFGWHVTLTRITLTAERRSSILYRWNGTAGPWEDYSGAIVAPVGRNVLYAQATDDHGVAGPITGLEVKLDYASPARSLSVSGPNGWAYGMEVGVSVA